MKKTYFALLFIILPLLMFAQGKTVGHITHFDGMAGASVKVVFMDSQGYMYFGTSHGMTRYDGTSLDNINMPYKNQQEAVWVNAIAEEDDNHLILCDNFGTYRYDKTTEKVEPLMPEQINCRGYCLAEYMPRSKTRKQQTKTPNTIFIGTWHGAYRYHAGKLDKLQSEEYNTGSIVISMAVQRTPKDDYLWVATYSGVACYSLRTMKTEGFYSLFDAKSENKVTKVACADNGNVYVGTSGNGVYRLNPVTRQYEHYILKGETINDMMVDVNDHLLVATEGAGAFDINIKRNKISQTYNSKSGNVHLRFNTPKTFYRARNGTDWFAYTFFGIDYTHNKRDLFKVYEIPGVFNSGNHQVRSFLVDNERVLVGTRHGLYITDRKRQQVIYFGKDKLGAELVTSIMRNGNTYFIGLVDGGVKTIDATTLSMTSIPALQALSDKKIFHILDDKKGSVWMTGMDGVYRLRTDSGKLRHFSPNNSNLPESETFCMGFDSKGMGWISTRYGLCCIDPVTEQINSLQLPEKLMKLKSFNAILLQGDNLFFLPQVGFPAVYNAKTGKTENLQFPIWDDSPASYYIMALPDKKYIYLTENDLYAITPNNVRHFGYIDGMDNMEFQLRSAQLDNEGQLWLATNGGLVYAKASKMFETSKVHTPINFTLVLNDHRFSNMELNKVNLTHKMTLSRRVNDFTVHFMPMIYANKGGLRFICRLKGYDDWRIVEKNYITYNALPPGNYTLEIKAVGMPDIHTSVEVDVPMLYSTIIIMIMLLAVLLFLGHCLYCFYTKKPYLWERFQEPKQKYSANKLDKRESQQLAKAFREYMENDKPYLKADIQPADIAKALGCSQHTLTQVMTQTIGKRYYDIIAEYRVAAFKKMVEDPQYTHYTITAIAEMCGFRSRTPFLTAFKKLTGMPPSDYVKSIRQRKSKGNSTTPKK